MKQSTDHHIPFPNQYARELLVLSKGSGCYVEDIAGKKYLDFGAGIAVNALGYGREDLAEIAYTQMKKLIHVSNLFTTEPSLECGDKLLVTGNFDAVHFGNSGTEANEAAIKYARLYGSRTRGPDCHIIASFTGAFHGRTMGALSVTPNATYQGPFGPLLPGTIVLPYNDCDILKSMMNASVCAIIVEVIQGEGGLVSMTSDFADALNKVKREYDILLIADEIQTGLGRTGYPFASSWIGLEPDIITLAKPLAGGLPLSATLIPEKVNNLIKPGEHGSTFGGGPVVCALASYMLDKLLDPNLLAEVRERGQFLHGELRKLKSEFPFIGTLRGTGLLQGMEILDLPGLPGNDSSQEGAETLKKIMANARNEGLLLLRSGTNILRIAPPLIISEEELSAGIAILRQIFKSIS